MTLSRTITMILMRITSFQHLRVIIYNLIIKWKEKWRNVISHHWSIVLLVRRECACGWTSNFYHHKVSTGFHAFVVSFVTDRSPSVTQEPVQAFLIIYRKPSSMLTAISASLQYVSAQLVILFLISLAPPYKSRVEKR